LKTGYSRFLSNPFAIITRDYDKTECRTGFENPHLKDAMTEYDTYTMQLYLFYMSEGRTQNEGVSEQRVEENI
jgi:hypothetical protein